MLTRAIAAAFVGLSCAQIAYAQSPTPTLSEQEKDIVEGHNTDLVGEFDLDTSIPDSPGFAAIGLSPTKVLDPGVEPVTYAALAQFLDDDHNLKTGFALGGTPYWWFNRKKRLDHYQSSSMTTGLERVLARTTVSIGFVDGGENPDRVGIGLKTDLLNDSDYRLDKELYNCVGSAYYEEIGLQYRPTEAQREKFTSDARQKLLAQGETVTPILLAETADEMEAVWRENLRTKVNEAAYTSRLTACRDDATARYAVRASWIVAAGAAFSQEEGGGSWDRSGTSLWTAYRTPLEFLGSVDSRSGRGDITPAYATVFANYDFDHTEEVENEATKYSAGTLGLVGGYERDGLKLSAQAGYKWLEYEQNTAGLEDDAYEVFVLSAAWRLNKTLWLKLDAGQTGERKAAFDETNEYFKLSFAYDLQ